MNAITEPISMQEATAWFGASPVLDALLCVCHPPGDEINPAQRLTRQYAAMNAMRVWTLVQETIAAFNEPVRTVTIHAPNGRWRWPADGLGVQRPTQFEVEIQAPHAVLSLSLHVQALPGLVPQLEVRSESNSAGRRVWITDPPSVPLGYAEARALLTALIFSIDADQVVLGAGPRSPS